MTERILERTELAYWKLAIVAHHLTKASPNGAVYRVDTTYLDYGQNWEWTTIIRSRYNGAQVLYPADWQRIVNATTDAELETIADEIRKDKFFGDK